MSFIHGYLLAGLVLVGVPILLHLIMRQKPKQLLFPAFRFLRQKARINQRKIRLQHWLLLALRMLLIAALCFALARPRLASSRVPFGGEQAVAAVFVFDTSASMEYTVADKTRLDDAKRRAGEILDELSATSQIAVFDTADDVGEDSDDWLTSGQLRSRIDGSRIRPANAPLNRQLERAYRLLQKLGDSEEAPPRFLFVFSDRTRESWDYAAAKKMQPVEGINTVFVDVGVDNPKDLSIDKVEIEPPVVAPGGKVKIRATVRATGDKHNNEISCQLDSEREGERRSVNLLKGESETYTFERIAPAKLDGVKEAAFHVVVKLGTPDALPSNNVRHATFLVRDKQKILTLVNHDPEEARVWSTALNAIGTYQCDVKTLDDAKDFEAYSVICLFQVPQPPLELWQRLARFAERGGGVVVVPGGEEMQKTALEEFNKNGLTAKLLPATLTRLITAPEGKGAPWTGFSRQHPITAYFNDLIRTTNSGLDDPQRQPRANGYWEVKPIENEGTVIAAYDDEPKRPALVERSVGKGRVFLFTTRLAWSDTDMLPNKREWNTYWSGGTPWFGFVLTDRLCRYLAGESTQPELNYLCGQPVIVSMPPTPFAPPFALQGPGLTQSETNIPVPDNSPTLALTQTLGPGNFTLLDGKNIPFTGFSVNIRPEENFLVRIPVEDIEEALGKDTVLAPDRTLNLREILQQRWSPPIELLPYLMMFLLLALTVESLLANFFYRRQAPASAMEPRPAALAD